MPQDSSRHRRQVPGQAARDPLAALALLLALLLLIAPPVLGEEHVQPLVGETHDAGPLLALHFGSLLGLAGYNLLLFLVLRERNFLLYVLLAGSGGLAMLAFAGLGAPYLWPPGLDWNARALAFLLGLTSLAAILFGRSFLDSASHAPRWHRLLDLGLCVLAPLTLASLLLPATPMLRLLSLLGLASIVLLLGCGLACLRRQVPAARVFVAAGTLALGGALLLALRRFGMPLSDALTLDALLVGATLELLLLSFGLAQRLSVLRQRQLAATLDAQQQDLRALQEQERVLEQRVAERTEALAAANARLRELALQDPLTGLANRTAMRQHLEQAWQRARRRREMLALILLDLDGFKPVNDCHGHESGDRLLVQVARRLQASARSSDLVARLGGDEFVLVCEGIGSELQAEQLAARILEELARPFRLDGAEIRIGASIGISFGLGCQCCEDLLREADQAMYRAKAAGRNRMHLGRRLAEGETLDEPAAPDEL